MCVGAALLLSYAKGYFCYLTMIGYLNPPENTRKISNIFCVPQIPHGPPGN